MKIRSQFISLVAVAVLLMARSLPAGATQTGGGYSGSDQVGGAVHSCSQFDDSSKPSSTELRADGNLFGCDLVMPHLSGELTLQYLDPYTESYVDNGPSDFVECYTCNQLPRHVFDYYSGLTPGQYRWVFQYHLEWRPQTIGQTYGEDFHDYTLP